MKHANPKVSTLPRFGLCCFIIEAKQGVTLICIVQFLLGIMSAVSLVVHDVRLQMGGYNAQAGKFQTLVGAFCLLFALIGFLGVYDKKAVMVKIFAYFLALKLVVAAGVFLLDLVALMKCEGWANTMDAQLNFSPTLYAISRKGVCAMARLAYIAGFSCEFGVNAYWTFAVYDFHRKMLMNPCFGIGVLVGDSHLSMQYQDDDVGQPTALLDHHPIKATEAFGHHYGAAHPSQTQHASFGKP
eukprot:TRINITY_DN77018_c0_g1_i1.p1 TRINITY_DN77018_c0_g1~~TRINITY_DN77018_c0_g1_i1.p1  ORF type:complete len:242 (+),score=50.82 TRINITY_DN77018_c0_g1_i1:173-898(+)